jgi:glycine oxidase|tara:strand:- start:470 stop:1648 length:1179 start_codon:yes stop_codon:yes gene_type:complete
MTNNADISVLGAGVFGLVASIMIKKKGFSVTVVDRNFPAMEASSWALGRVDPLMEASSVNSKKGKHFSQSKTHDMVVYGSSSKEEKDLIEQSYDRFLEFVPEIQDGSGVDVQLDYKPTLRFIYSEKEFKLLKKSAQVWTSKGFESEVVYSHLINKIDPRYMTTEYGAVLINGPVFVNSLNYQLGLIEYAKNIGVVFKKAEIKNLEMNNNCPKIITSNGNIFSDTAIISLGPWTGSFCKKIGMNVPIFPSKGEILRMTPPVSGTFNHHLHGSSSLIHKKDGDVWVAATVAEVGFNRKKTNHAKNRLLKYATEMLPDMITAKVKDQTVCFRPTSPDGMPIIDFIGSGIPVIILSGGGGRGIMQSVVAGIEVARIIDDKNVSRSINGVSLERFGL